MRWVLPSGVLGRETHFKIRGRTALSWIASVRPDTWSSRVGYVAWGGTWSCARCSGERDVRGTWDPRWTCDSGATECDVARTEWLLEYVHEFRAGAFGAGMHESGVHADGEFPHGAGSVWTTVRYPRIAPPQDLRIRSVCVSLLRLRQRIRSELRSEPAAAGSGSSSNRRIRTG